MATNIQKRREIRKYEALRDKYIEQQAKTRALLATVRTQLKEARRK